MNLEKKYMRNDQELITRVGLNVESNPLFRPYSDTITINLKKALPYLLMCLVAIILGYVAGS